MKSKRKVSVPLQHPLQRLEKILKKNRDQEALKLRTDIIAHPSPHDFLSARFPVLAEDAPRSVSVESVMAHTVVELADADRRLLACRNCPSGGGACAADRLGHPPGRIPIWQSGRLMFSGCARWEEFLMRRRIAQIGVPERLTGAAISDIHKLVGEEHYARFKRFAVECQHREAWAVFGGALSTLFCVTALRSVIKKRLAITCRFLRAPKLNRPLKMFFSGEEGVKDPLHGCERIDLLFISDLNTKRDPDWFVDVIQELCRTRYLESKATVLGFSDTNDVDSLKELASGYFGDMNSGEFFEGDHYEDYNPDRRVHICDGLTASS